ncbi:MAG: acetylglutamate kinase [Deltaproteobacteria bacterium]|nr:acetylglutamate kinase [Deltaproteobacteria bacterium]
MKPDSTEDLIVRLLKNLGSKKEVEQYLRLFSSVEEKRFAVIKVSGGVVDTELDALVSSIAFLDKVGLTPVVIHGAGPQLLAAEKQAGVASTNDKGERIVTEASIALARKVFQKENLRIVGALEAIGTRARPIPTGVFIAEKIEDGRLGFVGRVVDIDVDAIEASISAEQIPVLASLAETTSGQVLNVNADAAAARLALALQPFKVVFLSPDDGIRGEDGQILSAINLEEDYAELMAQPWLSSSTKSKLSEIEAMLQQLPRSSSVSVASPENLTRELFTHKGAGTLIRMGEHVRCHEDFKKIDLPRLRSLLENSFGRKLHEDYFEKKAFFRIYLAESYRATAILTLENGIPYLDKFAVTTEAQGDGVGGSLWQRMTKENEKLFWRSRIENEVNPWYFARSDGAYKSDKWCVFWCGLTDFDEIKTCIDLALAMPATLKMHSVGA